MGFLSIRTYNFRNLKNRENSVNAREIFLIGENGQGKTNFLEAIYYLCFGSSFKTKTEKTVIADKEEEMSIYGKFSVKKDMEKAVTVKIKNRKKSIFVDGKKITDRKELIENIPCILFSHADIGFINGPPERRRWFFNQIMSLYDLAFIDILRKYNKIIKARNRSIQEGKIDLIEVYDRQLAETGMEIQQKRKREIIEFNYYFSRVYKDLSLSDNELNIHYIPSWKECKTAGDVCIKLKNTRERDLNFGKTTTGPQRDSFLFLIGGKNFAQVASTGQLRLLSLILRIVQATIFLDKTGKKPILLIDDVFLEIDRKKKMQLFKKLPRYEQAFFTFLPDEKISDYKKENAILLDVTNGILQRK